MKFRVECPECHVDQRQDVKQLRLSYNPANQTYFASYTCSACNAKSGVKLTYAKFSAICSGVAQRRRSLWSAKIRPLPTPPPKCHATADDAYLKGRFDEAIQVSRSKIEALLAESQALVSKFEALLSSGSTHEQVS